MNKTDMIYEICKKLSFYDIINLYSALNKDIPNTINKLIIVKIKDIMCIKMNSGISRFSKADKNITLGNIITVNNMINCKKCCLKLTKYHHINECCACHIKLCADCSYECSLCTKINCMDYVVDFKCVYCRKTELI